MLEVSIKSSQRPVSSAQPPVVPSVCKSDGCAASPLAKRSLMLETLVMAATGSIGGCSRSTCAQGVGRN